MKPFFDSADRVARLREVVAGWVGTKFIPQAAIKGAGVDCVHLAAEVLRECGHLRSYEFPSYTMDGGSHLLRSMVLDWLSVHPQFQSVPDGSGQPGDVLIFRNSIESRPHHVGVYLGENRFASALFRYGVRTRNINEGFWLERRVATFRPVEDSQ